MQIDRIYYPVSTLGYGKRIGIWTIGCRHGCYNCSNPELWNANEAKEISVDDVIECIKKVDCYDGITITGGDPFEQVDELAILVDRICELGCKDILIYSGYTFDELKKKGHVYNQILSKIGVLVDGRYVDELNDNISIRGSSNQKIIVLNNELSERYFDVDHWERKTQILVNANKIQAIGLPIRQV